ncbi:sensor histidine kinase [Metabacillus fastidiosus]|uniref:histidine kinase n=1 Tax=Metabacillus fastidiosus TaxID=1458 RepID=A0ABU6P2J5_9BACI|nr:sensor histidine kinase [Metabacillus fastidiosus]MED4403580.1 histidine kinase dimerization/phospho-acceptor domain-containing protein [Metabacillus fastidiosus]MED4452373.1 histidine kinase dimerization/phospho-acceptor domain-containing protein [Metabacillus fastidiosus]MED4463694.1 histidine kinase dimerization/phospho-acceptor domain-containing protein [Metabacillus fastidiosus]
MDTKWRSKLVLVFWLILFTYGLSGVTAGISSGSDYLRGDYFKTPQFNDELNQFINYLSMFELNELPKTEAKGAITVSKDEIDEHRYRYGNLSSQISSIKSQYEDKVNDAKEAGNEEVAQTYVEERDKKIEDITNNFKSDEYIQAKIIKEKEQRIDEYYKIKENYRTDFLRYKKAFTYYLKDTVTGQVYTNIGDVNAQSLKNTFNSKTMEFIQTYPTRTNDYLSTEITGSYYSDAVSEYEDVITLLKANTTHLFEGKIAVPKSAIKESAIHANYYDFLYKKDLFLKFTISGLILLIISSYFLFREKSYFRRETSEKWRALYHLIPIDISVFGLICLVFINLGLLFLIGDRILYFDENIFMTSRDIIFSLMIGALSITLTFFYGKLLFERFKYAEKLKEDWKGSFIIRSWGALQLAFLNRHVGTQLFILLAAVFAFGAVLTAAVIKPVLILLYIPAFLFIGIPILVLLIRRIGYFNKITRSTNEIVRGNLEPDLPIVGQSILAKLANNINILKHGVRTSKKEQAKSERLKTELITNVSHDLRTPLTSIITYTELLKTPNLSKEDSDSYLEIIDRKSKRLKVLIDDLFEASKMASGNIELIKQKVDIVQLLQQSLAEYNEMINESSLQFRITNTEQPIYALVDGQKLWRVFENLISNILKYTLENTRVYISVKTEEERAIIEFKNISKYELSENSDELFERFKRGDTSRNTEGSGLGLAIAKSIVDLHGGSLDIEIDGDLFKVIVILNIE